MSDEVEYIPLTGEGIKQVVAQVTALRERLYHATMIPPDAKVPMTDTTLPFRYEINGRQYEVRLPPEARLMVQVDGGTGHSVCMTAGELAYGQEAEIEVPIAVGGSQVLLEPLLLRRARDLEANPPAGFHIWVNGRPQVTAHTSLTYGQVVRMAYPKLEPPIPPYYTITYSYKEGDRRCGGCLHPGSNKLSTVEGMVFDVVMTSNA